jgi:hypothetical protein
MKKVIIAVSLVAGFSTMANASIVQLDLFDLGCPTEFNWDSPYWQTDFDLGVTFNEISNVYIDWAGEITAGLAAESNPDEPFPLDVGISAYLGRNPYSRYTEVYGGADTYPDSEPFECVSKIGPSGTAAWSDLFDGQGKILLDYVEVISLPSTYIEHGSISLDRAILMVDGVIVPEPATLFLVGIGMILFRIDTHRTSRNIKK